MADKDVQARLEAIVLQTAEINLEKAEQEAAEYQAKKAQSSRLKAQRQAQFATDRRGKASLSKRCNHKMGGTPKNPYKGNGDTALKVIKQPDGFTTLILCVICPLRVFSPHPKDQSKKQRQGESQQQAKARVEKYVADKETFSELMEKSQDSISADFTQPMDCGITIERTTMDGDPVYGRRPCDTYAHA